jgi:hypothetical protein
MIDLLLVDQHSPSQLSDFLSEIFDCSIERIRIFGIDEFNSLTEELDVSTLDCVCVSSLVRGDGSQLLQLYRYRITDSDVIKRTIDVALKNRIRCYIPHDSLDGWIYIGEDDTSKHVRQMECDQDDCFLFQLI